VNREPATLIILAGGEAKRMGFPKHQLVVDGGRVLDTLHDRLSPLFVETLVAGRDIEDPPPGARLVKDLYTLRAALVGIHAGLAASMTDLTFVIGCDMPFVKPALVEYLLSQADGFDAVIPVVRGYHEPLCAAYRKSCLNSIERLIERGVLKISAVYPLVETREIPEPELKPFDPELRSIANLNEPSTINRSPRFLLDGLCSIPRRER